MTPMSLQVKIHPIIELSSSATNGMTNSNRKTKRLAIICFFLFLLRLGFRAFGYDLLYHNPNDPYGISDLIEVALALIYLVRLGLCILHALWILLRHWDQSALGASALLALCAAQWHSYDYLHLLAASLSIP
ncbi:hypothetical protein [Aeromonas sp. 1805]|uniref:hypothetical protein n=1 Tax=Aeromonas sp. 1805 TaxID=2560028 RepID=UPI00209C6975|nr:hypothetical protein [Aeromonas sp. 1805]